MRGWPDAVTGPMDGPVGTVAIAPHMRTTRYTELPAFRADVGRLVAGSGPTPRLDRLLGSVGNETS
jgi:hypothetical protein